MAVHSSPAALSRRFTRSRLFRRCKTLSVVALAVVLTTACGGGADGVPSEQALEVAPETKADGGREAPRVLDPQRAYAEQPMDATAAARLLMQATWGPSMADIDRLTGQTPHAWLQEQFATPSRDSHWAYVVERRGPLDCVVCDAQHINAVMESFWDQAARGPDALRQRLVFALSQILVISAVNSPISTQAEAHASYLDTLSKHAFGNYRDLLQAVALHPAMGRYLSHLGNLKEDPTTGRLPDENFAREVMQLFSIGLWQLNPDGTRRKDAAGQDMPTYGLDDVMGMAKVFTGWGWGGADDSEGRWRGWRGQSWNTPMQLYARHHSSAPKSFLGTTIPANTDGHTSLRVALDTLFHHPNVGPFLGRQLIQRLVSSNPSPAYVARVAAAFANNGHGVRGDLRAVVQAVLLDPEARQPPTGSPTEGKLREPLLRFGHWLRAFGAQAQSGYYRIWNLENPVSSLGQNPLRAPSVFNWYQPDYAPPGAVDQAGWVAPEFQITHETTVTGYANFSVQLAERGFGHQQHRLMPDLRVELALAQDPTALVRRLNLLLTANQLAPTTQALIAQAVQAVPVIKPDTRVHTAVALTLVSPEFQVMK